MERKPCSKCGERPANKDRSLCWKCSNPGRNWGARANQTHRYRRVVAERLARGMCEFCNKMVEDRSKLHVDHVNGNHADDRPENFQVLCVDCHVAKTRLQKEYQRH